MDSDVGSGDNENFVQKSKYLRSADLYVFCVDAANAAV